MCVTYDTRFSFQRLYLMRLTRLQNTFNVCLSLTFLKVCLGTSVLCLPTSSITRERDQLTRIIRVTVWAYELGQTRGALFMCPFTTHLAFNPSVPRACPAVGLRANQARPVFLITAFWRLLDPFRFPLSFPLFWTTLCWFSFPFFFSCKDCL